MTQSKIKGLGGRIALLAALSALMVVAGASAASAEVIVAPNTEVEWETEVTVFGTTVPSGTDDVAIVLCNAKAPGKRCDPSSGTETLVPESSYTTGISIPVRRGPWFDFDFTMGLPPVEAGTETTCLSETEGGEQCLVVVSFYDTTEKGPKPVGMPQTAPITFE